MPRDSGFKTMLLGGRGHANMTLRDADCTHTVGWRKEARKRRQKKQLMCDLNKEDDMERTSNLVL